jgi:hypothetical protein
MFREEFWCEGELLKGGVAALAGIGATLVSLCSADAKEHKTKSPRKDAPRYLKHAPTFLFFCEWP